MGKGSTNELLDIVWPEADGSEIRKGVLAYALFADPNRQSAPFPVGIWPAGTRFDSSRLTDDDWVVIMWTILPDAWPEPDLWCPTVHSTLVALSEGEAVVAWCALEGAFEVPPKLFDPDVMPDDVYAALLPGRFVCTAQLGKPYESLTRSQMSEFNEATNQRFGTPRSQAE